VGGVEQATLTATQEKSKPTPGQPTILNSDNLPLVDIVSWHPMYGTSPEFDP
jgi:hypothetical protein